MIRLVFVFALMATLSLMIPHAYAQESNSFSLGVSPSLIEVDAKIPSRPYMEIVVENRSNQPLTLEANLRTFHQSSVYDGSIISAPTNDPSLQTIFENIRILEDEVEVAEINLEPLQAKKVNVEINLEDKSIEPSDYYFSLIFISKTIKANEESAISTVGGVGTNIILSVDNNSDVRGQIAEFSVPNFLTSGPVPITLLVKNTGERFIQPQGTITIRNMFGNKVAELTTLPEYILSNSSRYLKDSYQASNSAQNSPNTAAIEKNHPNILWNEKVLFGLYSVEVNMKLSGEGPEFNQKIHFVAAPLYFLLGLSFVIFFLISIYIKARKYHK